MGSREMPGWLRIGPDDLEAGDQLSEWVYQLNECSAT
jgi:hypothetical protein